MVRRLALGVVLLVAAPASALESPMAREEAEPAAEATPKVEETVTVVAGPPEVESSPAGGVRTVPAQDLRATRPASVAQAIENVAGAATISEGAAAVPVLRGLSGGRTLLLIDGARVTAERRVGPSATFLDPASLEGVEIARGPGSIAYGSDALGGVLHLRTRRAEPGTPLRGRASFTVGAGTPQQRANVELTRGSGSGGLLVQGHWRHFDDWRSPAGRVPNSGSEDRGFRVRFDQVLAGGLLSAGWQSDFGRDVERPRTNSHVVRFSYPVEDSHRLTLGWVRSALGALDRVGATAFVGGSRVVTDQDRVATAARPRLLERADVRARDFHVRAVAENSLGRARVEAGVDVHGRFGLEADEVVIDHDDEGGVANRTEVPSIEDARRTDTGLFAQVDVTAVPAVRLTAGARVDRVTSGNTGGHFGDRALSHTALSGMAAATVGPIHGFSATAQVARGFRDPTLSDRYFRGPSGRGFITGNPALEPESSLQLDVALRYVSPRGQVAVYAYQYRIADLVERYEDDTDSFFFRNRGRSRIRGVEAEVQARLPRHVELELSAHHLEGRALDDVAALDNIPVTTLVARLRRAWGTRHLWARGAVFGRLRDPGPTEMVRPGYRLVDAGAGFHVGAVEVDVVGRNLLDASYATTPDARATLAAGRTGIVTATVRF